MAGTQFLCFADYLIYKGNDTYSINSCETIEFFYNIRTDLDKYKYAVHITKIILDVTNENENSTNKIKTHLIDMKIYEIIQNNTITNENSRNKIRNQNITNIEISNLKPWTGIYRNSLCGKIILYYYND